MIVYMTELIDQARAAQNNDLYIEFEIRDCNISVYCGLLRHSRSKMDTLILFRLQCSYTHVVFRPFQLGIVPLH